MRTIKCKLYRVLILTVSLIGTSFTITATAASIYVDNQLLTDCQGTYSIANRDSSGSDGDAYNTIQEVANIAVAGDIVFIREGTYTGNENYIEPANSGTSDTSRITYTNYGNENVTITDAQYGVRLEDNSYVTINGINFDTIDRGIHIIRGRYNHIEYCTFNKMRTYVWFGSRIHDNSQYNRISHCTFSRWGQVVNGNDYCGVLDLGTESNAGDLSDYNLIENSTFFYGGHHVLRINSANNIIRDNYFHNEEWMPYGDELYGNRNIEVYSEHGNRNLFEGNRIAFSGLPPDDPGSTGLKICTKYNIVRFNAIYHNNVAGIHMAPLSNNEPSYNHIYHNTIYHNGYNPLYYHGGLDFCEAPATGNVIKNNIFFDNIEGIGIVFEGTARRVDQIIENNWEEEGDPFFVDETVLGPFDPSLPDFRLQESSPCIDAAAFLTKTTNSAVNHTVIEVEDAGHFMDGWGMIEGDVIQLEGQTQTAQITDVDYDNNIITVDTPLSWQSGQGLSLAYSGNAPDIGAYEYVSGPPDTTAPSVPQNLTATAVSESQIDLSWSASSDPESGINYYKIYRDGSQIDTSVTTSYSNTGLNSGTTYSYEVSAVNGQGLESGRSNTAQATTFLDTTPPSIISINASKTSVEITFSESLDTTSAEQTSNYSINNGISINAASLDTDTVTLTTSAHTEGSYTITVVNVQDISGNLMTQAMIDYEYDDGLIAHWKFDDGSGNSAVDSSGNGNTGILTNEPTWTTGRFNGGLSFDGVDDAVEIGTADFNSGSGTIALWGSAVSFAPTGQYLFGHTSQPWSNRIQLYTDDLDGNLDLGLGNSHSRHTQIYNLDIETWYHIALSWDESNYNVYVNGSVQANGTYSELSTLETYADIGNNGDREDRTESFHGIIDEVRVYNRALTAGEILDLYNESTTPDTTPPVISNVQASNVTVSQATITWNTDELSTSQVEYGLDTNYGNNTPINANLVTFHSIVIPDLSPNTPYHFRVISADASENHSTSQDNIFTTAEVTYSITASAGSRGQISPSGITQVVSGGSQTYDITADTGYHIWDVLVDGSSVGAVSSYSFTNVTDNHTIAAIFAIEIAASAGSGGQISPSGITQVVSGGSQTYDITADTGYHIWDVLVDGSSVGAVSSHSFTNVTDNHTIAATFAIDTYTITASAGNGGLISPSGTTEVNWSGTQSYSITPNTGYHIVDVLVDGSSVGRVTSYSFTNVTSDHTIAATFGEQDITAPKVTNLSPPAGSIQALTNTLVMLDVTDSGDGVDAASVTIEVNGNLVYTGDTDHYNSLYGDCRRTGTRTAYSFFYQSNEMFDYDQTITVTVNASDLASPSNSMSNYSYSLMTEMHSFGQNKQVNSGLDNNDRPVTVYDSSGNIWTAWHAGPIDNRDIYINKLAAGAENFGSTVQLTNNANDQYNPAIALDSNDKLYVVWQDNREGDWDIYVSTSVDGVNWSTEIRVNDPNEGNQVNPAIVIDGQDFAHVVWQDDSAGNQDIYIATSSDVFATKTVSQVTSDNFNQIEPAIAADSDNTIYVVWTDGRNGSNDIYGAASNNSWTNVAVVNNTDIQSSPAIAAESTGSILHLLWVDDTPGNNDIYYASSDGLPGSPLTGSSIIDDSSGADQLDPTIAVTGSTDNNLKVFACWQDWRDTDTDLYFAELSAGSGTNVFVGDSGSNADQGEPAIGIGEYDQPYIMWADNRSTNTDIYYAGSTFIEPVALASELVTASASSSTTVGTDPQAIITAIDDVSIVVPAGACPYDVTITLTKIANLPEFAAPCLGGYDFGPSGIQFSQPVMITIPYVFSSSDGSVIPYWFNSLTGTLSQQGITDIQDISISSSLHALSFKTTHFTAFYLLEGGGAAAVIVGGGGGGGGCSVSASGEGNIVEYILPYIALAVVMVILKMRDARNRQARNMTAGKC